MYRLGQSEGTPLIFDPFEAWDYGPVVPEVYKRAKPFGSGPVRNVFHWIDGVPAGSPDYHAIREAVDGTRHMTPGALVESTHWKEGAWATFSYEVRGESEYLIPTSCESIMPEWKSRKSR